MGEIERAGAGLLRRPASTLHRRADRRIPADRSLSVTEAVDLYIREHVGERVIDRGRQEIAANHLQRHADGVLLADFDVEASRAYRDARRAEGVADSTVRRELGTLTAAAQHCLRRRHISADQMPTVELPLVGRTEAPWLTAGELAVVLGEASGRLRDFITLAYYTAGRRGSIERLTKSQVDLDRKRINLQFADATVLEQNSKKRRPIVPVFPEIEDTAARLMAEPGEWLLGSPASMYRPFRAHLESLGMAGKANPHILRHSRATHMLQKGVPLWTVAKLLGDTTGTVERTYGHHCPDYMAGV